MKVVLTGSHFTPAFPVIEDLRLWGVTEILYIGRKYTMEGDKTISTESKILPTLGVSFFPITAGRLRRDLSIYSLSALLKIPVGFFQALAILLKESPDIVVSFGGYVGLPVVLCAWFLSIPIIIHEQGLNPGIANSISALFADKIALTFNKNKKLSSKEVLTGNPIRDQILHPKVLVEKSIKSIVERSAKEKKPLILITGGNQGSQTINKIVTDSIQDLSEMAFIIHQTGDSKYKDYELAVKQRTKLSKKERYFPIKWIDSADFGVLLKKVDIVVSRAGINTLLELSLAGSPTLVIPLPTKEQLSNAKYFNQQGLAEIIYQNQLNREKLVTKLKTMLENIKRLKRKTQTLNKLVIRDASAKIVQEILVLSNENI